MGIIQLSLRIRPQRLTALVAGSRGHCNPILVRRTDDHPGGTGMLGSSWRFAMASIACSMNVTRGSGTSVCGSVLGVNSGRGSAFVVLGIYQFNPDGPRKVPSACYGHQLSANR